MAAQVKEDAENNATVHCSLSRMVKDLDKQGTHLRNQAEALTLKAVTLKARETEIDLKMDKIDTQLQEMKQESDRGDAVIHSIQELTKKSMSASVKQVTECTQYIKAYTKKKREELEQKAEELIIAQTQIMSPDGTCTCCQLPDHPLNNNDITEQRLNQV